MHKVFVRIDERSGITEIQSDCCAEEASGLIEIDEGEGDRFQHAQGNYLPKPLMDAQGRYRYKLVDGAVVARTPEELAEDTLPTPMPNNAERLAAVEAAVLDLVLGGGIGG